MTGRTIPRARIQTRKQKRYFARVEKERERIWRQYRECVQRLRKTGEPLTLCELACKRDILYKRRQKE